MIRRVIPSIVAVVVFSVSCYAATINSSWVGGEFGAWDQAMNWGPATIPDNNATNNFNVVIDGSDGGVDIGLQQHRTINRLDCYGYVEIGTWTSEWVALTLTDANGLTNHGELEIEPDITGNVTNKSGGYLYIDDADIDDGNLYNEAGAKLEIESVVEIGNGNFINEGSVSVVPGSELWVSGGSFTNNGMIQIRYSLIGNSEDDGISEDFYNAGSGGIWGTGNIWSDANIVNEGGIFASSGDLAVHGRAIMNTGLLESKSGSSLFLEASVSEFSNRGTIIINCGSTVSVKNEGLFLFAEPNDCILSNEPNGIIELVGGVLSAATIKQKANADFSGFGNISGNVDIAPNGSIRLTGPTNIVGNVTIGADATLEVRDGITLITGNTTNNGTIKMVGGRVVCQGGLTNNGNVIWEPGIYTNEADFDLDGSVDMKDFAEFADTWLWQSEL